ncbi:MAG: EamA family transporter [Candidatus Pacebacteria bacterium]|nr:EamA family transporter [Candidatus Paceibacterota bacterium]
MSTTWLFFLLFAQVTWAVGNYIDHYLLSRYKEHVDSASTVGTLVLISSFFMLLVGTGIYALAHGLVQWGVIAPDPLNMKTGEIFLAMGVGVLEVLWLIPYLYALDEADETQVCPLFQLVPVFGFFLGITFFNEVPSISQILAGCVILTGSVVLNLNVGRKKESVNDGLNMRVIGLMAVASFIIAIVAFLFKNTALEANYWGAAFWMSMGSFLTGVVIWIIVPSYRRDFHAFLGRRDMFGIAVNFVNEIADSVAILAFYGAVLFGPSTALVQSSIAYQPLFVLLIGLVAARFGSEFHAERLRGVGLLTRVVGIFCIVLGSVLLLSSDDSSKGGVQMETHHQTILHTGGTYEGATQQSNTKKMGSIPNSIITRFEFV